MTADTDSTPPAADATLASRAPAWMGWVPVGCLLLPFALLMGIGLYFFFAPPPVPASDAAVSSDEAAGERRRDRSP